MTTQPVTVGPGSSVREAIELLIEHNISGLPVVEADGTIVGVLSEKDLLKVFYEPAEHVRAIMTADPITIHVEAPLEDVLDCLMTHDFRRVLIHDGGKLVGLISRADLMPAVLDALRERT